MGRALAEVKALEMKSRPAIKVEKSLIDEILTAVELEVQPKKNEDEIDLDDSDDDDGPR